jgi:tetratricopeptide (TPR) repeat protein
MLMKFTKRHVLLFNSNRRSPFTASLIFIFSIFLSFNLQAKIYKCELENGTLSYQKNPCVEDNSTIRENMDKAKALKEKNKNKLSDDALNSFLEKNVDVFNIQLKNYDLTVLKLKQWRVYKKVLGDKAFHLKFLDVSPRSEISLLMDFIMVNPDESLSQEELNGDMMKMGQKFLESSTQTKVTPVKVVVTDGIGVIAIFTDASLVNKSSYPPGEYLHTIKALIFKKGVLVHATLLSNDLESVNQIMALQSLLGGIEIKKNNNPAVTHSTSTVIDPVDMPFENYYNGNKRESVAMFENVIADLPENFKAWMGLCLALRDTNRLQSAFIACDKALSFDPENIEVHVSLVNLYSKARLWKKGLQFIKNSIPQSNNGPLLNAITNLGFYAMQEKELTTALGAFNEVKSRGGDSVKLDVDMAIVHHLNGNSSEAMMLLLGALSKSPKDEFANNILNAILDKKPVVSKYSNTEPYVVVPDRLNVLGIGKSINQKPDKWVKKIFPVKGIGKIMIEVPESWYERIQIIETDSQNDEIGITLIDFVSFTIINIDIGKVGKEWNKELVKKKLTSSLSIFFDGSDINLMELKGDKVGYYFPEKSTKDEQPYHISSQHELRESISIKSLVTKRKKFKGDVILTNRIIKSIKLFDHNQTSFLNVSKKELSIQLPIIQKNIKPTNYLIDDIIKVIQVSTTVGLKDFLLNPKQKC